MMHYKEQSLRNQNIQEEDVAYAAFHDTVYDVGEELTLKYDEYEVLSDAHLQIVLDELDKLYKTRITDLKNLLTSATLTRNEQDVTSEACQIESNLRVIELDRIVIDDASILSNSRECDSNKSCPKNPDLVNDMTVAQDVDEQTEKDSAPGATLEHKLHTDLDMAMLCIVEVSTTKAENTVCESRYTSGLKHRWRWKQG